MLRDNEDFRTDSEYFSKINLQKLEVIESKDFDYVGNFAFVTDGIHESIQFSDDGEVNLISAKSPKENYFDLSGNFYIPKQYHEKNPRTALDVGDIIISSVGTIGNCAVVDESILPANSDRHVGIIRVQKDFLPHYISTFLVGKYGRFQTLRESTGNVQLNLFIYRIRRLKISKPTIEFQTEIENLVKQAHGKLEESKALYAEAENLLLDALGLLNWQFPTENTAVKSLSESFLQTSRLDAEYFQPYYTELFRKIKSSTYVELGQYAEILSGFPWKSEYFIEGNSEEGEPFVRIRDCKPGAIDNEELTKLVPNYATEQNVAKANRNDLVVGMDGIKYFYASIITEPCYVNQRVSHVQIKENELFTPEYILILINGLVGQSQFLREMTIANTVGHITNNNVRELIIPLVNSELMKIISQMVKDNISTKAQSKQLLELAKRAVEMAIERDEAAGLAMIEDCF